MCVCACARANLCIDAFRCTCKCIQYHEHACECMSSAGPLGVELSGKYAVYPKA